MESAGEKEGAIHSSFPRGEGTLSLPKEREGGARAARRSNRFTELSLYLGGGGGKKRSYSHFSVSLKRKERRAFQRENSGLSPGIRFRRRKGAVALSGCGKEITLWWKGGDGANRRICDPFVPQRG